MSDPLFKTILTNQIHLPPKMFHTFWIICAFVYSSCSAESDSTLLVTAATLNLSDSLDNEDNMNGKQTYLANLHEVHSLTTDDNAVVECNSTSNCPKSFFTSPIPPVISQITAQSLSNENTPIDVSNLDTYRDIDKSNDSNSDSFFASDFGNSSVSSDFDLDSSTNFEISHIYQAFPTGYDSEGNELDSEVRFTKKNFVFSTVKPNVSLLITLLPLLNTGKKAIINETTEFYEISATQEPASTVEEKQGINEQNLPVSSDYREQFNLVPIDQNNQVKKSSTNQTSMLRSTTENSNNFPRDVENSTIELNSSSQMVDSGLVDFYLNDTSSITTNSYSDIHDIGLSLETTTMSNGDLEKVNLSLNFSATVKPLMESKIYTTNDSEILEGYGERNRSYFTSTHINILDSTTEAYKDILTERNIAKSIFTIPYPESSVVSHVNTVASSSILNITQTDNTEISTETTTNVTNFPKDFKLPIVIPSTHGPIIASGISKQFISPQTTKSMETNETAPTYLSVPISELLNNTNIKNFYSTTIVSYINNTQFQENTTKELQYDSAKSTKFQSVEINTSDMNIASATESNSKSSYTHDILQAEKTKNFISTKSSLTMLTTIFHKLSGTDINTTPAITQFETTQRDISKQNVTEVSTQITDQPLPVTHSSTDFDTELNTVTKLTTLIPIYQKFITDSPTSNIDSSTTVIPFTNYTQTEVHREGKHIPFSTKSILSMSSVNGFIHLTPTNAPGTKNDMINTGAAFEQIHIEELSPTDRANLITAIIQISPEYVNRKVVDSKILKIHGWLLHILEKEFRNWTKDPFDDSEEYISAVPFGNVSIFYIIPTPECNSSNITLTFIIYNVWKNDTLPVDFVLGILNFYSRELKESINASSAHFYHGYLIEENYLLSIILDKYGIIIFTISLAVIGILFLVCLVIYYRKKTRGSVHCLTNNKFQQNMQEGLDLTPAIIILQDEKGEKVGNKICDDEGWLVPITDVPQEEERNMPFVQDTKL